MGAETRCFVRVGRLVYEWEEVYAVTLDDARDMAFDLPGVCDVQETQYEKPEEL